MASGGWHELRRHLFRSHLSAAPGRKATRPCWSLASPATPALSVGLFIPVPTLPFPHVLEFSFPQESLGSSWSEGWGACPPKGDLVLSPQDARRALSWPDVQGPLIAPGSVRRAEA